LDMGMDIESEEGAVVREGIKSGERYLHAIADPVYIQNNCIGISAGNSAGQ
ncbi:MAG: hypothetical protein H6Q56_1806, partial [Deltaproteobacteria bacterium]|nr:hypothetical protein [Deltaproteobacteria bacterium]